MTHLSDDERLELNAYRIAVDEIGQAGWTTCMMYVKCRVRQITQGLPEQQQYKICKLDDYKPRESLV
jgi:hypothetical protein